MNEDRGEEEGDELSQSSQLDTQPPPVLLLFFSLLFLLSPSLSLSVLAGTSLDVITVFPSVRCFKACALNK